MSLEYLVAKKQQANARRISTGIAVGIHVVLIVLVIIYCRTRPPAITDDFGYGEPPPAAPPPAPPVPPPPMPGTEPPPPAGTWNVGEVVFGAGTSGDIVVLPPEQPKGQDASDSITSAILTPLEPFEFVYQRTKGSTDAIIDKYFPSDPSEGKFSLSGPKGRLSGRTALAILDLPGTVNQSSWSGGELEDVADFVSRNTRLRVELGARAISFVGAWGSFDNWLAEARGRTCERAGELSRLEPDIDALDALADAVPCLERGDAEAFRATVQQTVAEYLRLKYEARFDPRTTDWAEAIDSALIKPWETEYLREGRQALQQVCGTVQPSGRELRGLYLMLRMNEMMRLPVLLCQPRGVPATLHPENLRMLRTYVHNGGFIYFTNTADINQERGVRGLIGELLDETMADPEGDALLARMRGEDQEVSGFTFRDPEPQIAHPWTFFPMIIPHRSDVVVSIFNKRGAAVFSDTLRRVKPGAYLQKLRHYRWHAVDNAGLPVESGYYVYRIEAGLFVKTGALRVSSLRLLPEGKHGVYSAFYNVTEVPSTVRVTPEQLSYGTEGVFGASLAGRMVICYAEGYREKDALRQSDEGAREAALKWMTNVVMYALSERSLARR